MGFVILLQLLGTLVIILLSVGVRPLRVLLTWAVGLALVFALTSILGGNGGAPPAPTAAAVEHGTIPAAPSHPG